MPPRGPHTGVDASLPGGIAAAGEGEEREPTLVV